MSNAAQATITDGNNTIAIVSTKWRPPAKADYVEVYDLVAPENWRGSPDAEVIAAQMKLPALVRADEACVVVRTSGELGVFFDTLEQVREWHGDRVYAHAKAELAREREIARRALAKVAEDLLSWAKNSAEELESEFDAATDHFRCDDTTLPSTKAYRTRAEK